MLLDGLGTFGGWTTDGLGTSYGTASTSTSVVVASRSSARATYASPIPRWRKKTPLELARERLRKIAFELHPDRTRDPVRRVVLQERLADVTRAFHELEEQLKKPFAPSPTDETMDTLLRAIASLEEAVRTQPRPADAPGWATDTPWWSTVPRFVEVAAPPTAPTAAPRSFRLGIVVGLFLAAGFVFAYWLGTRASARRQDDAPRRRRRGSGSRPPKNRRPR